MAKYTIDITKRFEIAFGFTAARVVERAVGLDYRVPFNTSPNDLTIKSKMGTTIADRFTFVENFKNGNPNSYTLELPPLVDLRLSKKVNATPINDGDFASDALGGGEVVDAWGAQGWDITFRGILVDMDKHQRPFDQLRQLLRIVKIKDVIEIKDSAYFNLLEIKDIYITGFDLPALEAYEDTIPYTITARSYVPAELFITD